jgi:hypothetical protein
MMIRNIPLIRRYVFFLLNILDTSFKSIEKKRNRFEQKYGKDE